LPSTLPRRWTNANSFALMRLYSTASLSTITKPLRSAIFKRQADTQQAWGPILDTPTMSAIARVNTILHWLLMYTLLLDSKVPEMRWSSTEYTMDSCERSVLASRGLCYHEVGSGRVQNSMSPSGLVQLPIVRLPHQHRCLHPSQLHQVRALTTPECRLHQCLSAGKTTATSTGSTV
jgi:hypothetical protein